MLKLCLAAGAAAALTGCVVGPGYGAGYGPGYGYGDQGYGAGPVYDTAPVYGYGPAYGAVDIAVIGHRDYDGHYGNDYHGSRPQPNGYWGHGDNRAPGPAASPRPTQGQQGQQGYGQRGPGWSGAPAAPAGRDGGMHNSDASWGANSQWRQGGTNRWRGGQEAQGGTGGGNNH